jgi:hypothetical protein
MNTSVAIVIGRTRLLPRRHRIAHLRALLRRQPAGSLGRGQLAALLRAELAARAAGKECTT